MTKKEACHFFYYWFPVLFYCMVIFIQSSYPSPEKIPDVIPVDKLLHFIGYAFLGLLLLRGFKNSGLRGEYRLIMAASIVLTGLYGASDELHQHYVPYRSGSVWDALFDVLGGIFGVYIYQRFIEKYPGIGRI